MRRGRAPVKARVTQRPATRPDGITVKLRQCGISGKICTGFAGGADGVAGAISASGRLARCYPQDALHRGAQLTFGRRRPTILTASA